jgi:spore germination protein
MKKTIIFFIMLSVSIGSGFTMTKRIIDDIYLVTAVGYDYVDDNLIRGTVVTPIYKETDKVTNKTYSDVASLIYENREKIQSKSSKPIYSGKLEVALYNYELAEKGIFDFVDNLQRDPAIGTRVNLAIAKGSTKEILSGSYEDLPTGIFLSDLIVKNGEEGNLPKTNLKVFVTSFYTEGQDPFLPIIKKENDKIIIDGIAVFKDDKVVHEIPFMKAIYLKALIENFSHGRQVVKLNEEERASIHNINSNLKFVIKNQYTNPEVSIHLDMEGYIREYSGKKMSPDVESNFEKKMEEDFEEQGMSMIKEFQELGSDPVGIGEHVRRKTKGFDQKKWETIYPTLDIKVEAKVDILEHGVIN